MLQAVVNRLKVQKSNILDACSYIQEILIQRPVNNKSKHLAQFPVTLNNTGANTSNSNINNFTCTKYQYRKRISFCNKCNTSQTIQCRKNIETVLSEVPIDSLECTNITTKDSTQEKTSGSNKSTNIMQETSTSKEFMMIEMSDMRKKQTKCSER